MNKNTQHTPGPWELSNDHKPSPYVIRQVGRFGGLASVKFHGFNKTERAREEQTANARLIAAAPDLLEALKVTAWSLLKYQPPRAPKDPGTDASHALSIASAAIAKAEGGAE